MREVGLGGIHPLTQRYTDRKLMITYGKQILNIFIEETKSLNDLSHMDYVEDDIRQKISFLGGKLELFLKTIAFPTESSNGNLISFISKAKDQGLPTSEFQDLDAFRKLYNLAKHEPNASISLIETIKVITAAKVGVEKLVSLNLGLTSLAVCPQSKRVFWIAAWDHFVGGDTEIHIIIPGVSDHWLGPPTMDYIYINIPDWDSFKSDLKAIGGLHSGSGLIPDKQIELFKSDSDFLDALVYEGEYRDLLVTASKYECRQNLLSGLNRGDSSFSMLLALLLALIDVIPTANFSDLASAVKTQAVTLYAVPESNPTLDDKIDLLVTMVENVPESLRSDIKGPLWLNTERFDLEKESAFSIHPTLPIIVTKQLAFAMEWRT